MKKFKKDLLEMLTTLNIMLLCAAIVYGGLIGMSYLIKKDISDMDYELNVLYLVSIMYVGSSLLTKLAEKIPIGKKGSKEEA